MDWGESRSFYLFDDIVSHHPTDEKSTKTVAGDNSPGLIQVRDGFKMSYKINYVSVRAAAPITSNTCSMLASQNRIALRHGMYPTSSMLQTIACTSRDIRTDHNIALLSPRGGIPLYTVSMNTFLVLCNTGFARTLGFHLSAQAPTGPPWMITTQGYVFFSSNVLGRTMKECTV